MALNSSYEMNKYFSSEEASYKAIDIVSVCVIII